MSVSVDVNAPTPSSPPCRCSRLWPDGRPGVAAAGGVKSFLYPSPLHYRQIPELVYDGNSTILSHRYLPCRLWKSGASVGFPLVALGVRRAERLREETRLLWSDKFGLRLMEGYGATETSPVLAVATPFISSRERSAASCPPSPAAGAGGRHQGRRPAVGRRPQSDAGLFEA